MFNQINVWLKNKSDRIVSVVFISMLSLLGKYIVKILHPLQKQVKTQSKFRSLLEITNCCLVKIIWIQLSSDCNIILMTAALRRKI